MTEFKPPSRRIVIAFCLIASTVFGALAGGLTTIFLTTHLKRLIVGDLRNGQMSQRAVESRIVELIEDETASIAVVEQVTPAVVSIIVKKNSGDLEGYQKQYFFDNPLYQTQALEDGSVSALVEVSSGTGFFVTSDGYVLTNRHVVSEENGLFFVVTNDGEELPATLVDIDPLQDIAILHVEGEAFATVTLADSEDIRIGQTVIAIGNTLSEFRNTVTKGVVSGINRRVTAGDAYNSEVIEQAIQTDAAINPGNSGGPLINLLGEVIGINTAVSFHGESVAFAIPINEAKRAVEDVQLYGRILRPWLGIRYVLVIPKQGIEEEQPYEVGAFIVSGEQPGEIGVFEGSPADLAGIQEGDVIIAVNGTPFTQDEALAESISVFRPGDVVKVSVLRDQTILELSITLAEYGE